MDKKCVDEFAKMIASFMECIYSDYTEEEIKKHCPDDKCISKYVSIATGESSSPEDKPSKYVSITYMTKDGEYADYTYYLPMEEING